MAGLSVWNVRKLQGHWIIEMSEMIATANAKSIEEIKSFLSKQKETYKVPYETHPADRLRQCIFAGTTNRQDFLPRDRTGNRRFIPVPVVLSFLFIQDTRKNTYELLHTKPVTAIQYICGKVISGFNLEIKESIFVTLVAAC